MSQEREALDYSVLFDSRPAEPDAGTWTQFGVFVYDKCNKRYVGGAKYWWIYFVAFSEDNYFCVSGPGTNPHPQPER